MNTRSIRFQWLLAILYALVLTWIAQGHTGPGTLENRVVAFSEFDWAIRCLIDRCPDAQGAFRLLLVNGLGNIVVFLPLGFLLWTPLNTVTSHALIAAALLGLLLSIAFELAQLFIPGRVTAIDDIVLNTVGAWAGAWLRARPASHSPREAALDG